MSIIIIFLFPQTRRVTHRPRTVWYNQDLKVAKREKRQAERKYRKSGLAVHKQLFEESCATYNNLLEFSKCSYYKDKIENASNRQLFKIVDGFFTPRSPVLPTHNSSTQLVKDFNDFFIQRIIGFRDELQRTLKTGTCHSIACYLCLVQQAALRFIMLLKPYQRNLVPWILCQPDY